MAFALPYRLIIDNVVNLRGILLFSIQQKKNRGCDIVSMDLINKTIIFNIVGRRAVQESGQQCRAPRSVDPGEPHYRSTFVEHQPFHFQEDAAGLAEWFCFARFRHPGSVALRIHAGAACEKDCCPGKTFDEVARPVEINMAIHLSIAAARTDAVDHRIEYSSTLRELSAL